MAARRPGARPACPLSSAGAVSRAALLLAAGLGASTASAGDPGPLCAALQSADAVVEVELTVRDAWPAGYREKQWAPGPKQLAATVATATVTGRLKGDPQGWAPTFDDLGLSRLSLAQWDGLFAAPTVTALVFLRRTDGRFRSLGYLEDAGGCSVSLCWAPLQAAVRACLAPAATTRSAQPGSP